MKQWIWILVAVLSVSGCASLHGKTPASSNPSGKIEPRPAWVDGEDPTWPRSRYVLGVGASPDQQTADDAARAEIARTFSVNVSVATSAEQSESSYNTSQNAGSVFSSDVGSKIKTTTNKVLEGVEIVARWCEAPDQFGVRQCYALATLARAKALRALSDRASEIDALAKRNHDIIVANTDTFSSGMAAAQTAALAREMTGLNADARVLGGSAGGMFDFDAERSRIKSALAAMQVVVAVTGEDEAGVTSALLAALNNAGLNAKRGNGDSVADLLVTAEVAGEKQDAGDPKWARHSSTAKVAFLNKQREAIGSFVATAREDATSAAEAKRRSYTRLEKAVREKAGVTLNALLK